MLWEGRKFRRRMAKVSGFNRERGFKAEMSSSSELQSILLRDESNAGHLLGTILLIRNRILHIDATCYACPTIWSIQDLVRTHSR